MREEGEVALEVTAGIPALYEEGRGRGQQRHGADAAQPAREQGHARALSHRSLGVGRRGALPAHGLLAIVHGNHGMGRHRGPPLPTAELFELRAQIGFLLLREKSLSKASLASAWPL